MRIILADHHAQTRWALKTVLEEQTEFDLVGVVEDAQSLIVLAEKHPADLFLVDRSLPGCVIEELIDTLHGFDPRPFVIVMSNEFEYSRILLKAGADAFVSKEDHPEWLLDTLHRFEKRFK
jgi:two-component system response regulator FimZ (fimbrial Z protein)